MPEDSDDGGVLCCLLPFRVLLRVSFLALRFNDVCVQIEDVHSCREHTFVYNDNRGELLSVAVAKFPGDISRKSKSHYGSCYRAFPVPRNAAICLIAVDCLGQRTTSV